MIVAVGCPEDDVARWRGMGRESVSYLQVQNSTRALRMAGRSKAYSSSVEMYWR